MSPAEALGQTWRPSPVQDSGQQRFTGLTKPMHLVSSLWKTIKVNDIVRKYSDTPCGTIYNVTILTSKKPVLGENGKWVDYFRLKQDT